ncbi:MAG TPA: hypothetical protein VHX39_00045, partial [Acetobacteraceae bacterium]|nr:hypothetical protein [Acetobacteraceae bacterium]
RSEAEAAVAECDAALAAALARVPTWSGGAEALVALAPPVTEVWRRLDADMTAKRNEVANAAERLDDEIAKLEQARNALTGGGTIADDAALAHARSHRDVGWRLIYRRAFTADPPSAAEEREFASGVPLPLAFERAIGEADAVADRRAASSEILGLLAAARRNVDDATQRVAAARERLRLAGEAHTQTRRLWSGLCHAIEQDADAALADVLAFLNARDQAIDVLQRRALALHMLQTLCRRQRDWAVALAAALNQEPADLAKLLGRADQTLAQAREQQKRRQQLEALQAQATKELRDATVARHAAEAGITEWQRRWQAVLADLGRPADEEPAETEAVLQILADIEKEQVTASSLLERINGMKARVDRFTGTVHALCQKLPGLTAARDPMDAVRELHRQLDEERVRDLRRHMLQEGRTKAREADAAATRDLIEAQAKLHAVLTVIGADTVETAEQRLALSDERDGFEAKHVEAEAELRQAGDGHSIETLAAETATIPVDEDTARIEAASLAHRQANEAAQQAAEDASRLRHNMEQIARKTEVNVAAADQQAAIASLSRTLDEALLYHTAAALLSRALDAVEQSGGSVMLRRLSGIFQTMTNGIYSNVTSDRDDSGNDQLVMIQRDFPEERQRIDQLSEGTRDQLFLALRVAAIEDHLKTAEPLPFIGDDILQTFDDDRALAALRVLTELSQHTQVIVLTHHRHILELATRLPPDSVFECTRETPAAIA